MIILVVQNRYQFLGYSGVQCVGQHCGLQSKPLAGPGRPAQPGDMQHRQTKRRPS